MTESETMIEKLTHVPIVVSDQKKALRFYTEVLGFEKRADYQTPGNPRWLTVAPKGQDIELILVEGTYKLDPRLPPEADSGGYPWAFNTDDWRQDADVLRARGGKVYEAAPLAAQYWDAARFTDPRRD